MAPNDAYCTCGHSHDAHEHYRRGSDCGVCGKQTCKAFAADNRRLADTSRTNTISHVA